MQLVRNFLSLPQATEQPNLVHKLLYSARQLLMAPSATARRQMHESAAYDWRSHAKVLGCFLVCFAVALGVRALGLLTAFELWVDEILYAQLGQSLNEGEPVPRLPDGPFFLHPPGFFFVETAVINLFRLTGDSVEMVMQLRWINAVLGACTAGLAFLVVKAAGGRQIAWLAAGILAFEPFVLRSNSHVFLETLAMAAVIAGLALIVSGLKAVRHKHNRVLLWSGGLLFGLAIVTKDFFALCTVLPVVLAVLWRRTIQLYDAGVILFGVVLPYLAYMLAVILQGMLPAWWQAKELGLRRLIGLDKVTGFTADGAPSLAARLLDNLSHFGTSYVLLGLCPLAAALLCLSRRRERRLIGLMGLVLGFYGVYSATFGTFEEHYGYGVMIAAVLSTVLVGVEIVERRPRYRAPVLSAGVAFVLLTAVLGIRLEASIDNGFVQVKQWSSQNLPASAKVSVTNSTGELAFANDPRFGIWPSAALMKEAGAEYILTQSLPTSQGYGYMQPAMHHWLEANATPVFRLQGRTNGATTVWHLDGETLNRGVQEGVGTPTIYGTGH